MQQDTPKKRKWIPLLARRDSITGRVKFEWREFKLFLAGKPDAEKWRDYYLFTYAREYFLGVDPENGEKKARAFKKIFMDVIKYMAVKNESYEITNSFAESKDKVPVFTLYSDHHIYHD